MMLSSERSACDRGITAALGWIGHWCANAARTKEGVTSFEMGLLKARLRLETTQGADMKNAWLKEHLTDGTTMDASLVCRLRGLDAPAMYEITDLDAAGATVMSGKDLMDKGLTIEVKDKPDAAVIVHR